MAVSSKLLLLPAAVHLHRLGWRCCRLQSSSRTLQVILSRHLACPSVARYASPKQREQSLIETTSKGAVEPSLGEKVKESTKTASYGAVIVLGLGITGFIMYVVLSELFSSKSVNSVYGEALKRCKADGRIQELLGTPIKGYGEETRRGRRRHVTHLAYSKDNVNYLRMKFYVQGVRKKGTVNLEMKENDGGDYEYRYLFVEVDDYARPSVIVLEDNR